MEQLPSPKELHGRSFEEPDEDDEANMSESQLSQSAMHWPGTHGQLDMSASEFASWEMHCKGKDTKELVEMIAKQYWVNTRILRNQMRDRRRQRNLENKINQLLTNDAVSYNI